MVETIELLGLLGDANVRKSGFRDVRVPYGFVLGRKNLDYGPSARLSVALNTI
jgi:hypothetical protein